ncbi:hypothetical protein K466DRAFT_570653, partial [Polyporus arcularius HHB13444]
MCDMVHSSELMKYPLAIISKLLEVYRPDILVGYDIGCLGHQAREKSSTTATITLVCSPTSPRAPPRKLYWLLNMSEDTEIVLKLVEKAGVKLMDEFRQRRATSTPTSAVPSRLPSAPPTAPSSPFRGRSVATSSCVSARSSSASSCLSAASRSPSCPPMTPSSSHVVSPSPFNDTEHDVIEISDDENSQSLSCYDVASIKPLKSKWSLSDAAPVVKQEPYDLIDLMTDEPSGSASESSRPPPRKISCKGRFRITMRWRVEELRTVKEPMKCWPVSRPDHSVAYVLDLNDNPEHWMNVDGSLKTMLSIIKGE